MIQEDYCSYEVAKLLKEKEFEGDILMFIDKDNVKYDYTLSGFISDETIPCPTHQMAMKWLREIYKVIIVIDAYHADHWEGYIDSFEISIYSHASTIIVPNEIIHQTDYTKAVEAALKFCLENLI